MQAASPAISLHRVRKVICIGSWIQSHVYIQVDRDTRTTAHAPRSARVSVRKCADDAVAASLDPLALPSPGTQDWAVAMRLSDVAARGSGTLMWAGSLTVSANDLGGSPSLAACDEACPGRPPRVLAAPRASILPLHARSLDDHTRRHQGDPVVCTWVADSFRAGDRGCQRGQPAPLPGWSRSGRRDGEVAPCSFDAVPWPPGVKHAAQVLPTARHHAAVPLAFNCVRGHGLRRALIAAHQRLERRWRGPPVQPDKGSAAIEAGRQARWLASRIKVGQLGWHGFTGQHYQAMGHSF